MNPTPETLRRVEGRFQAAASPFREREAVACWGLCVYKYRHIFLNTVCLVCTPITRGYILKAMYYDFTVNCLSEGWMHTTVAATTVTALKIVHWG